VGLFLKIPSNLVNQSEQAPFKRHGADLTFKFLNRFIVPAFGIK
jgi:hypothetical protein